MGVRVGRGLGARSEVGWGEVGMGRSVNKGPAPGVCVGAWRAHVADELPAVKVIVIASEHVDLRTVKHSC